MIRPAVFIDKDGTLVEDVPYNVDPARIALAPGAGEALRRLQAAGYALVVVSNQSGVARGYFPESALAAVEARIRELLAAEGAGIDAFLYCPHLPDGAVAAYAVRCGCRKPAPGLQLRAAEKLELDLPASWMVGDILDDVEAGNRAGCRTVLLDVGHETEWLSGPYRRPTACAHDLLAAVHMIVTCPRPPSLRAHRYPDSITGAAACSTRHM
jgi:D-glycero-D-manno-heptose 1,7-bisphosphate phosphatase